MSLPLRKKVKENGRSKHGLKMPKYQPDWMTTGVGFKVPNSNNEICVFNPMASVIPIGIKVWNMQFGWFKLGWAGTVII